MRAPFQAGEFPAPVKYGYASVGRVERGPGALQDQTVFVLYPHQTRYVVPAAAVHVVPQGVPVERAVLAANVETALNVMWDARPHVGDRVPVIGAGTVGCLVAWLAGASPAARCELVDVESTSSPGRAARWASGSPHRTGHSRRRHSSFTPSGSPAGLGARPGSRRLRDPPSSSSVGSAIKPFPLPLGGAFHARRLKIVSSQVGTIAPAQRARWDTRRRMNLALASSPMRRSTR